MSNPLPGMYEVSGEVYDSWTYLRTSRLKKALTSWAHFHHAETEPSEDTAALFIGRAAHLACFEPERFAKDYLIVPKIDGRTKEGKAARAELDLDPRPKLNAAEAAEIAAWTRAVMDHPVAGKIVRLPAKTEVSVAWVDERTGIECKGRIDRLAPRKSGYLIVDLKTAQSAAPRQFAADAIKYGYDLQAAQYVDGLRAATGAEEIGFLWIVVEKTAPYVVEVYSATDPDTSPDFMTNGRYRRDRLMAELVKCLATGIYPGYSDGSKPVPLRVPAYAIEDTQ